MLIESSMYHSELLTYLYWISVTPNPICRPLFLYNNNKPSYYTLTLFYTWSHNYDHIFSSIAKWIVRLIFIVYHIFVSKIIGLYPFAFTKSGNFIYGNVFLYCRIIIKREMLYLHDVIYSTHDLIQVFKK